MDGSDQGDDRNFRVSFSNDGLARLRERVKEKLKEFLSDYTDDILVEYVVVLLRHGKSKGEARKELDVFLTDDTDPFVSWLWDHLSSNLHLYIQAGESSFLNEKIDRNDQQPEHANGSFHLDSDYERDTSVKETRSRRKREWSGLIRDSPGAEPPPLLTSELENFHAEDRSIHTSAASKRSRSGVRRELNQQDGRSYSGVRRELNQQDGMSRSGVRKEFNQHDEQRSAKRDGAPIIGASRRLLQFAVREAVGTVRSVSRSEPASKRLRSVVSTFTRDSSLEDHSQKVRPVARVPPAIGPALKAAAEAAEDVIRSSANVFDRLGCNMNGATTLEEPECEGSDLMPVSMNSDLYGGSEAMMERDTGLVSGSESDNDGYGALGNVGHSFTGASQTASSRNKDDDSLMVQYRVAQDADEVPRKTRMKDQDLSASGVANSSRKIVNISVNVNTWKPPDFQPKRDVAEAGNQTGVQASDPATGKPGFHTNQESNAVAAGSENEIYRTDARKEVPKTVSPLPGSYSSVRPTEDADSRTIFVSNVHFGATKDTLSRHFNKFGEVLKVIIVTDAATGKPKGSAYVEFMRKEAADLALSLNGTSFMSRMLKVVRRSPTHHEAAPMMAWPRLARASPFASRVPRLAYPRGIIPTAFRARLPLKTGARSLQWKRDTSAGDSAKTHLDGAPMNQLSSNPLPSPGVRPHTYIRSQSKPSDENAGPVQ